LSAAKHEQPAGQGPVFSFATGRTVVVVMTWKPVTIVGVVVDEAGCAKQYSGVLSSYPQRVCFPLQYRSPFALPSAVPRQVQPGAHFCGGIIAVVGVVVTAFV
jgi:hypothetical protein